MIAACCLLLLAANLSSAKSWHRIVPLHSTRDDVRKLLGKPTRPGDLFEDYEMPHYTVTITYATDNVFDTADDCDNPGFSWWDYYHAAMGTVLGISVRFDYEISLTRFKIPNFNKLAKDEPDSTLSVDYFDAKRGIQYSIRKRKIHTIEYGPSTVADANLRCAADPEADARETRVEQMCKQLFGPMIDQRMGLYPVNQFYVLKLVFDRHGNVISLHVEPKYYYDWVHIDWEQRDAFPHLAKSENQRLLAQVDQIKSLGPLVQSVTTNSSGWREETYRDAVLEWDEVGTPSPLDASRLVRWFTVFYVKRRQHNQSLDASGGSVFRN